MPKIRFVVFILSLAAANACKDTRLAETPPVPWEFETHQDHDFFLPDDWEINLWAESPQLYNPTNMDVDARGRIWVAEAVNYRDFNNAPDLSFDKGDRIVILEDTNGDGKSDQSKVFVQDKDLQAPLGIAVIGNKVIVSCAPHLIVYTDDNGDDVPDLKEILLTGFGGYDHDHSLHALVGGPDGKWYFNTGNAGPHLVQDNEGWNLRSGSMYTGGTPYNTFNEAAMVSDDGRIWVGGLALRMNSDGTGLEVMAHNFRNAYELAVDSYGNMWQNDNDDQVLTCRTSWIMEGGNAGYFSADGSRSWQADQRPNQEIFSAHWHQDDPGVIPAGDNTGAGSPTGIVRYEGDAFGPQYRGMLLSADAGRNLIFGYQPVMKGAGYQFERKDLISSLAESTEGYIWNELDGDVRKWFRPSDVTIGTDGAIYIADWYDPVVGGHLMHDTVGYGRIYRITPAGQELTTPHLDLSTLEGQLSALKSPAINVRITGFKKLKEQGPDILMEVKELLQAPNPFHQARAVWLLAQLGTEGISEVKQVLTEAADPALRVAAYRALNQSGKPDLKLAAFAAKDPSPAVRREVAISLRDMPFDDCQEIFHLLVKDIIHEDRYYLEALGIGLQGKESDAFIHFTKMDGTDPLQWSPEFKRLVWRLHPPEAIAALKTLVDSDSEPQSERLEFLTALAFINETSAVEAMFDLSVRSDSIGLMAQWWLDFRRFNNWLTLWDWAAQSLDQASLPENVSAWQEILLNQSEPLEERKEAAILMTGEISGARLLISLAAEQKLSNTVMETIALPMLNHADREVRSMSQGVFESQLSVGLAIKDVARLSGNPDHGIPIFNAKCSTCHRIGDNGQNIGPNLSHIGGKFDKFGMLDALINPSASIGFGYQQTIIKTADDQVFNGFLLSRNKQSVVLQDIAGNRQTIPLETISSEKLLQNSMMPDPASLGIDEQSLADLTAYLLTLK